MISWLICSCMLLWSDTNSSTRAYILRHPASVVLNTPLLTPPPARHLFVLSLKSALSLSLVSQRCVHSSACGVPGPPCGHQTCWILGPLEHMHAYCRLLVNRSPRCCVAQTQYDGTNCVTVRRQSSAYVRCSPRADVEPITSFSPQHSARKNANGTARWFEWASFVSRWVAYPHYLAVCIHAHLRHAHRRCGGLDGARALSLTSLLHLSRHRLPTF